MWSWDCSSDDEKIREGGLSWWFSAERVCTARVLDVMSNSASGIRSSEQPPKASVLQPRVAVMAVICLHRPLPLWSQPSFVAHVAWFRSPLPPSMGMFFPLRGVSSCREAGFLGSGSPSITFASPCKRRGRAWGLNSSAPRATH